MSETPASPPPAAEPAPSIDPVAPAPPAKKPGPLRLSAIILLLLVAAIGVALFPFVIEPWIVGAIKSGIKGQGFDLSPESKISVSLLGGKVTCTDLAITETYQGATSTVLAAKTLTADLAVWDSIMSGDVIVDELVAKDASGNLRRRGDGTIPLITPKDGDGKGWDWKSTDWVKLYEKYGDYLKKKKSDEAEQAKKPPAEQKKPEPVAEHPGEWPKATVYKPVPAPGKRLTRVLVRKLDVSGGKLGLPDDTPFDVAGFAITGSNVTLFQDPGETMTLAADLKTAGAGPLKLDFSRTPENGSFDLDASQLPVAVLASKPVSGDLLTPYNATGTAQSSLKLQWKGWDYTGAIVNVVSSLDLNPAASAGATAQQVAQTVKGLKGQPITWPMKLGGNGVPMITDFGVDEVIKGNAAAKGVIKDKATEEGNKLLDKELNRQPAVKDATGAAKGLLQGLGK